MLNNLAQITVGEILMVSPSMRLIYLGDGNARSERQLYRNGKSDQPTGKWEVSKASAPLTQPMVDEWIKRKS